MFRGIGSQFRKGIHYVQNSRIWKFIYDPDAGGRASITAIGLRNAAVRIEKEIARREAYLDVKHATRNVVVHGVVAPAVGLALTKLAENIPYDLNGYLRGSDAIGYGFPLIWKEVYSTVVANPVTEVIYQPWCLVENAIFWVAISEAAFFALLKGINHYQLWQLRKRWRKLTLAPSTRVLNRMHNAR
ncbi:hypothetical protein MUP01_07100 [Candidatus Bathyarchaeota archaeon]|nr:hypothetical protein [Candidatus Bathyarchaeota archaeon]